MNNGVIMQESDREGGERARVMFQVHTNRKRMDLSMIWHTSAERNINSSAVIMFQTDGFLMMGSYVVSLFYIKRKR